MLGGPVCTQQGPKQARARTSGLSLEFPEPMARARLREAGPDSSPAGPEFRPATSQRLAHVAPLCHTFKRTPNGTTWLTEVGTGAGTTSASVGNTFIKGSMLNKRSFPEWQSTDHKAGSE